MISSSPSDSLAKFIGCEKVSEVGGNKSPWLVKAGLILTDALAMGQTLVVDVLIEQEKCASETLRSCIGKLLPIAGGAGDGQSWSLGFSGG